MPAGMRGQQRGDLLFFTTTRLSRDAESVPKLPRVTLDSGSVCQGEQSPETRLPPLTLLLPPGRSEGIQRNLD